MMIEEIYPFDKKWVDMVHDIMNNGGTFWITQRTDTNQFYVEKLTLLSSSTEYSDTIGWVDEIPILTKGEFILISASSFYPTEELANKFAPKNLTEGGCYCCGNGSTEIPIRLMKYEHKINK